jgi:O-antigen/teichoic acid export membrane protein
VIVPEPTSTWCEGLNDLPIQIATDLCHHHCRAHYRDGRSFAFGFGAGMLNRRRDGDFLPSPGLPGEIESGLRRLVLRGGGLLFVRQVISIALNLLGVLVITRVIGPEHYGSYAAAIAIYQYTESLGESGISVYLIRRPGNVAQEEYYVASLLLLAIGIVFGAGLQLCSGAIAGWVNVAGVERSLGILAFALPVQLLARAAAAKLERTLDYRRITAVELISQFSNFTIAVPLAFAGYGAWSLVVGWMSQVGSYCVLAHVASGYLPRLAWDSSIARRILAYALSLSLAQWIWQLRLLANPLIVGHFLGAAAVGQVSMAIRFAEGLSFMRAITWRLSIAILARMQSEPAKLVVAVTEGMQLQMLAIAPILLGFGWTAGWLVPEIFGSRWMPTLEVYPFIALATVANAQFNMHASVLFVLQRNYQVAQFNIFNVALFATGVAVFVPLIGFAGYGWAEISAFPSYFLLHHFISRAVGCPSYRVSAIWWAGTLLGLFSRQLGSWAIAMPFVALLWPDSLRRLRAIFVSVRGVAGGV